MRTITRSFIIAYLIGAAVSPPANADLYSPSPYPTDPAGQVNYCKQFCGQLVSGSHPLGLNGKSQWSLSDDQWCVDHGSATNPQVAPDPTPTSSSPPPNQPCKVAMINGDTSCDQTTAWIQHCGWHNGQVEQQCEAFEAANGGKGGEKVVMMLDIAAAGTCAVACFMEKTPGGGAGIRKACDAVGIAASTTEIIETMTQKSSAVGKLISSAMGGFGIYKSVKDLRNPKGRESCMAAVMFGLMAGMRAGMIHSQDSAAQNAAAQVISLLSTSSTTGQGSLPMLGSTGASGGGASGGATGATLGGDPGLRCVSSGGSVSSCTGASSSAADAGGLQNSGLAGQLAPQAQQLAASDLGRQLANGTGDVGQAIGAMGGGNAGDAGGAIATLASAAREHAMELAEGVPGTSMGGGGGGGGAPAGGEEANPMAALAAMLNPQQKDQAPAGGTLKYGGNENTDIWHTNTDQNIFQIISTRIEKASTRLR